MNATMEKITDTIKANIEIEYETAVFSYLFDKGYSFCQSVTDEDIAKLEGNVMMTTDFVQSLVRCARDLTNEFELIDIMQYIRCELWMMPEIKELMLYESEVGEESFEDICDELNVEYEVAKKVGKLTLKVICEEE